MFLTNRFAKRVHVIVSGTHSGAVNNSAKVFCQTSTLVAPRDKKSHFGHGHLRVLGMVPRINAAVLLLTSDGRRDCRNVDNQKCVGSLQIVARFSKNTLLTPMFMLALPCKPPLW